MLNFNSEFRTMFNKVIKEYEQSQFIPVHYPATIEKELWEYFSPRIVLPKVKGTLYFIFDDKKNLLYLGKTKVIENALLNHLKRVTSRSTASILPEIQDIVCESKDKRIYLKVLTIEPKELSNAIKPYLVQRLKPKLVRRLS